MKIDIVTHIIPRLYVGTLGKAARIQKASTRKYAVRKVIRSLLLLFSLAVLLAIGSTAQGAQREGSKPVRYLNYATLPMGSLHYAATVVQAKTISDNSDIRVMVQPAVGPLGLPPLVGSRQADLAIGNALTVYWAYRGMVDFKQPNRFIRVLQAGSDLLFTIITHKGTGIKSIPDLKGRRFTCNYPTSALLRMLSELEMQAYGLSLRDVTAMKAEFDLKALQDLADKRTDAAMATVLGAKMHELATQVDPVILPFDPGKFEAVHKEMPPAHLAVTPDGIPKIPAGIPLIAFPTILWCHKDIDDDTAYKIVKILVENQQKMVASHNDFKQWTPEKAVRSMGIPYHPGAIKYYRQKGLWTPEMEKQQQELLSGEK